jgi:hypothetical protein
MRSSLAIRYARHSQTRWVTPSSSRLRILASNLKVSALREFHNRFDHTTSRWHAVRDSHSSFSFFHDVFVAREYRVRGAVLRSFLFGLLSAEADEDRRFWYMV